MKIYELRKQPVKDVAGKRIEIIEKEIFKSKLPELLRKARQLQLNDPYHFYWVFTNHKQTSQ